MCAQNQVQYRREVWLIMHKTDNPDATTSALRLYMDESGDDDPNTPHAIIGGLLIRRETFEEFEGEWERLLLDSEIHGALHMKEFGKHGRFGGMSTYRRAELFQRVSLLIRQHRAKSFSVSVHNKDFKGLVPSAVIEKFGVYGMCFVLAVYTCHLMAKNNSYKELIPLILDAGNSKKAQVVESHSWMVEAQRKYGEFMNVGSLTFEDDENFGILQAADVVAWLARRRMSGKASPRGFSPLDGIFNEHHLEMAWTPELLSHFGERFPQSRLPPD